MMILQTIIDRIISEIIIFCSEKNQLVILISFQFKLIFHYNGVLPLESSTSIFAPDFINNFSNSSLESITKKE